MEAQLNPNPSESPATAAAAAANGGSQVAAASATEAEAAPPPEASNTIFHFQHKVFDVPHAVFRKDRVTERVGLYMQLGGNEASIELAQIARSFHIEPDSEDGEMMRLVEKSLR